MATIIAPCRGVDQNMLANFDALLHQDMPEYEVIFVIDDASDPAAGIIESAWQESERHVKLIVAPKATASSQKVQNLREGVLHADPRSEVFVFVDSDTRTPPGWLRALIAPLEDDSRGAATGYRWFISEKLSLAGELRSVWNASIASALGPNEKNNFCWGGSMAIRRDVFERLRIRERWDGTLSDDFAVTRALREGGLGIKFVPQAMTATSETCTFAELMEFTTRQIKITRVYMPGLWLMSFVGSGLFCIVMAWAILIAALSRANSLMFWTAAGTFAIVATLSIGKATLRLRAIQLALPDVSRPLAAQFFAQNTLWLFTPAIFLYNCLAALISRRIVWRGISYELVSAEKTGVRGSSK